MKHEYLITVFTATYNRHNTLVRLYESLKSQNVLNFEWLIVDDGSTDGTEELVKAFILEDIIPINYIKKDNGGKHTAINNGLDLAKGVLFFIVDSDDYLTSNATESIELYYNIHKDNYAGLVFRKGLDNNLLIGSKFPKEEFVSNHIEKTYKFKLKGDLAEVLKTEVLQKCKFNEEIKEKFCAESLMWNRVANLGYNLLFIDKLIYIAEYLEGGLSANSIKNRRNSSNFTTLLYKELAESNKLPFFQKIRTYINYWRFSFFNKKTVFQNFRFINFNFFGIIALPFGFMMKIKDDLIK